jgi:hypothetical protein
MNETQLILLGAGISLVTTIIVTSLGAWLNYWLKRKERTEEGKQRVYYLYGRKLQLGHQLKPEDAPSDAKSTSSVEDRIKKISDLVDMDSTQLQFFIGYFESAIETQEELTELYHAKEKEKLNIGKENQVDVSVEEE